MSDQRPSPWQYYQPDTSDYDDYEQADDNDQRQHEYQVYSPELDARPGWQVPFNSRQVPSQAGPNLEEEAMEHTWVPQHHWNNNNNNNTQPPQQAGYNSDPYVQGASEPGHAWSNQHHPAPASFYGAPYNWSDQSDYAHDPTDEMWDIPEGDRESRRASAGSFNGDPSYGQTDSRDDHRPTIPPSETSEHRRSRHEKKSKSHKKSRPEKAQRSIDDFDRKFDSGHRGDKGPSSSSSRRHAKKR